MKKAEEMNPQSKALIEALAKAKSMDKKPPQTAAEIRREMLEWLERKRA